jgi:hypothetical protein
MTQHAKLSASGSHTWLNCTGSIKAQQEYVDSSSHYADEGTCAHELSEHCLLNSVNPFDFEDKPSPSFPNIIINREMCSSVQMYIDYINSIVGDKTYENQVDFSDYAPEGFGTADCIIYNEDDGIITIVDLKYGKGVRVHAHENSQLKLYALGALAGYSKRYKIKTVNVVIVQPRLDHIDEFGLTVDELYRFGEFVKIQAAIALSDDAPRTPGDEQCRWCKHKPRCPELLQLTSDSLMSEFDNGDTTPVNRLTDDQLSMVLKNSKLIASWLSAVEDYVKDKLENGEGFTGYKLVNGRSSRGWTNEQEAIEALSELYPPEEIFEQSFLSVAKAEKLVGKKNMQIIDEFIVKRDGRPTLVPESDNRPSISVSANDFD